MDLTEAEYIKKRWQEYIEELYKKMLTTKIIMMVSMGLLRVRHDFTFTFMHWRRKWQPTPVFLPGESQGRGSLVGCPSMGSYRVGHN